MGEFKRALDRVLKHEGGYVNHPRDPGGATNKGVTQRTYDAYRTDRKQTSRSVRDISNTEVEAIYRRQYWDKVDGDQLPDGLAYCVFDGAVNSGPSQSIKWLQRSLGKSYRGQVDGIMGSMTHAAIRESGNLPRLIDNICDRRLSFLQALSTWSTFGKGWASRVSGVRSTAKAWTAGSDVPVVEIPKDGAEKGRLSDAAPLPSTGVADGGAGVGVGTVGAGVVVIEIKNALEPYASTSALAQKLVIGLVVLGGIITAVSLFARYQNKKKAAKMVDALDIGAA